MISDSDSPKPLLVTCQEAQRLIGCKNTKFWRLVAEGLIETVPLGSRTMVRYRSLERLAEPQAA